jgi:SAM-dependent methyltransferase
MPLMNALKDGTPWPLRRIVRRVKARLEGAGQRSRSSQDVFTQIYREKRWPRVAAPDDHESAVIAYSQCVSHFIRSQGIRTVVDLGCGNFSAARRIAALPIHYMGVDVVAPLIEANRRRFPADNVLFRCLDIVTDPLPKGELCLLREVFQHLSNAQILAILPKLRQYRWVIVTELQLPDGDRSRANYDKPQGAHTRVLWDSYVDLAAPPFELPHVELMLSLPAARSDDPRPVFSNSFLIRNAAM